MLFHYSLLPRLVISLLGGGLGLVGVLFQQVLRNPLAEPTTLGVATGAQLGITVTTLWRCRRVLTSQFAQPAPAGGALVFGVAWGNGFAGDADSGGLVVSLYCGAVNQLLVIFHHDAAAKHVPVEHRTLTQTDWSGVQRLWPQLLGGVVLAAAAAPVNADGAG
jgi:iron complex transport system permease protein